MTQYNLVNEMDYQRMRSASAMDGYRALFGERPILSDVITAIMWGEKSDVKPEALTGEQRGALHSLGAKRTDQGGIYVPGITQLVARYRALDQDARCFMGKDTYQLEINTADIGFNKQKELLEKLFLGKLYFVFNGYFRNHGMTWTSPSSYSVSDVKVNGLINSGDIDLGFSAIPSGSRARFEKKMALPGHIDVVSEFALEENIIQALAGSDDRQGAIESDEETIKVLAGLDTDDIATELWANFVREELTRRTNVDLTQKADFIVNRFGAHDFQPTFHFPIRDTEKYLAIRDLRRTGGPVLFVMDQDEAQKNLRSVQGEHSLEREFALKGEAVPTLAEYLERRMSVRDLRERLV